MKLRSIQSYLGVSAPPIEHHQIQEDSCRWIEERDDFQSWMEPEVASNKSESYVPSIYWAHASPGAGKTILAAHVISFLQESQMQCAGYHFHVGKKATQSLGVLLRSSAFNMANSNGAIRNALGKLCEYDTTFDLDDARGIWSTVFEAVILQVRQGTLLSPYLSFQQLRRVYVSADTDDSYRCRFPPPGTGSLMPWTSASNILSSSLY